MLLFNIFFGYDITSLLPPSLRRNRKNIRLNILLVGNILYELFLDVQDELLEQAP